MDSAPGRNPLGLVVAAFVITLPFDYDAYLIHRDLSEFGILIIVTKTVFFVLYLPRSRFAWYMGFGLTAMITVLALLLIYRGAKAGELDCSLRHFLELTVAVPLVSISGASENGTFATFKIDALVFRCIKRQHRGFALRVSLRDMNAQYVGWRND